MTGSLQMRLTQMQELTIALAIIAYIAFTSGIPMIRTFLSSQIGKAVGLLTIVYVWKYVSALVALLLAIAFLCCGGMREGVDATLAPAAKSCPAGFSPKAGEPGKCAKKDGDTEIVVDAREPPKAETKPEAKTVAPLTIPPPPPTPPPAVESFVPNMKEPGTGGCAFSPL